MKFQKYKKIRQKKWYYDSSEETEMLYFDQSPETERLNFNSQSRRFAIH